MCVRLVVTSVMTDEHVGLTLEALMHVVNLSV